MDPEPQCPILFSSPCLPFSNPNSPFFLSLVHNPIFPSRRNKQRNPNFRFFSLLPSPAIHLHELSVCPPILLSFFYNHCIKFPFLNYCIVIDFNISGYLRNLNFTCLISCLQVYITRVLIVLHLVML